jgi:hypothetical protein
MGLNVLFLFERVFMKNEAEGATTLGIMTLSITTLSIMTFSTTTQKFNFSEIHLECDV